MNRCEVMRLINEIEESFPVDTWIVDGIHIWPLIRIPFALRLYKEGSVEDGNSNTNSSLHKITRMVKGILLSPKALITDRAHNAPYKRKVDAVVLSNTVCRTKLGDGWYDRICDPIIEELTKIEWSSQFYEATGSYEYRLPRVYESTLIQMKLELVNIISFISGYYDRNPKWQLERWKEFVAFCHEKKIYEYVPTQTELFRRVFRLKRLCKFFEHLLTYNQPRMAFVECYYGYQGMAFALACKRRGIPSIDIQHGVQGDTHVAYGSWNRIPTEGYELLPTNFWCWNSHEANAINKWSSQTNGNLHTALVGPNLWLDKWRQGEGSEFRKHDEVLRQLIDKKNINVLFTLQPKYHPAPWFYKAINAAPPEWKWFMRLHPRMIAEKERFQAIFNTQCPRACIEIDYATELPLLAWLRYIDVHVTQCSSCVTEAEAFRVPSIIIHVDGIDMYNDQVQNGMAFTAFNAANLIEKICVLSHKNNDMEYPNAFKNTQSVPFKKVVKEILTHNRLLSVMDLLSPRTKDR